MCVASADEFERNYATETVPLYTDLHAANFLAAQREPWLVIDPSRTS
jgi:streptomycin 6-kinase